MNLSQSLIDLNSNLVFVSVFFFFFFFLYFFLSFLLQRRGKEEKRGKGGGSYQGRTVMHLMESPSIGECDLDTNSNGGIKNNFESQFFDCTCGVNDSLESIFHLGVSDLKVMEIKKSPICASYILSLCSFMSELKVSKIKKIFNQTPIRIVFIQGLIGSGPSRIVPFRCGLRESSLKRALVCLSRPHPYHTFFFSCWIRSNPHTLWYLVICHRRYSAAFPFFSKLPSMISAFNNSILPCSY